MIVVKLKELAEAKGYTEISKFQRDCGTSVGTTYRWWHNKTNGADFGVLETFCRFLECEPGDLIKIVDVTTTD